MAETKKYFWLRLKRDFFKRHDIRILEAMPNGKEIVLFYLKLLTESIDHEGLLRFSESVPYTPKMLAVITNTDEEIAEDAITELIELGLLEILDDETYKINGIQDMIGTAEQDEHTRESTRLRVKAYRERQKESNNKETLQKRYSNVTCNGEKEKELEIEKDKKNIYGDYRHVRMTSEQKDQLIKDIGLEMAEECIKFLDEYIEMKGYKAKNHYLCIKRWVVDAVKERQAKKPKGYQDPNFNLDELSKKIYAN